MSIRTRDVKVRPAKRDVLEVIGETLSGHPDLAYELVRRLSDKRTQTLTTTCVTRKPDRATSAAQKNSNGI